MQDLIASWPGQAVVVRHDAPTGTWIFIALHDATLGRPTGGTRMKAYTAPEEGLYDAMRLAEGMTYKWATLGIDRGGGKAVLAVPGPLEGSKRSGLLQRYGELLENLAGAFATAEDLGTTPEDITLLRQYTRYVVAADPDVPATDPGPFTARGVLAGIQACLWQVFGDENLGGRTVLVQGVGDVGAPLARLLAEGGATLLLSDLDEARAHRLAGELGATWVAPAEAYVTPCDVFAPCAIGGVLGRETIAALACRIVAGSANNQLVEEPADADRLHQRGILYAPDYVINGGGAFVFDLIERGERDPAVLMRRVEQVGDTLEDIFREAAQRKESPLHAARRQVERTLAARRQG